MNGLRRDCGGGACGRTCWLRESVPSAARKSSDAPCRPAPAVRCLTLDAALPRCFSHDLLEEPTRPLPHPPPPAPSTSIYRSRGGRPDCSPTRAEPLLVSFLPGRSAPRPISVTQLLNPTSRPPWPPAALLSSPRHFRPYACAPQERKSRVEPSFRATPLHSLLYPAREARGTNLFILGTGPLAPSRCRLPSSPSILRVSTPDVVATPRWHASPKYSVQSYHSPRTSIRMTSTPLRWDTPYFSSYRLPNPSSSLSQATTFFLSIASPLFSSCLLFARSTIIATLCLIFSQSPLLLPSPLPNDPRVVSDIGAPCPNFRLPLPAPACSPRLSRTACPPTSPQPYSACYHISHSHHNTSLIGNTTHHHSVFQNTTLSFEHHDLLHHHNDRLTAQEKQRRKEPVAKGRRGDKASFACPD
ncbi:hypothetical protein C7M84_001551 [Penaeus vannamei]|uniref:Uncharacterized protein n=1 Tax=Penaeus vannamei TaxID=6689 RepID=A0A3R7MDI8_PENVA|nr:hypothetical protein C7M84_001551 [Penaeus vannamei]